MTACMALTMMITILLGNVSIIPTESVIQAFDSNLYSGMCRPSQHNT